VGVEPAARGTLGTVRNAALLLTLLAEGPPYQQLTDLAERSGLSVPTVHRLLRSLVQADLVAQDPTSSRYGLGAELVRLSQRYLARLPVLAAVSPYLVPLRDAVGATVQVAILVRGSVVYVDRVDGADGGLYRSSHRVHPALETSAGKLLLARADDATWEVALEATTAEQRKSAEAERDAWRRAAYLVGDDPGPELAGEVAVAVLDGSDRAAGALAAALPSGAGERDVKRACEHLTRAARAAGRTLGHG
jgi:IclR family transcriptional regulator, acetate operon repressor